MVVWQLAEPRQFALDSNFALDSSFVVLMTYVISRKLLKLWSTGRELNPRILILQMRHNLYFQVLM